MSKRTTTSGDTLGDGPMRQADGRDVSEGLLADVESAFEADEPMLTEEIEDRFDLRHEVAVDCLERLRERGVLERERIGTQLAVWWLVDERDFEDGWTEVTIIVGDD